MLGLSSTGSLRLDWPVGTIVCPDDFYAPQVTVTAHDDARSHTVPGFDPSWRSRVLETWRAHAATPIVDGGVYAQTSGPRFETPAEVRALARIGDLVGMTIAAECILASELGLAYAAVCVVDNLANGLDPEPLTIEAFQAAVAANRTALLADLDAVLPAARRDGMMALTRHERRARRRRRPASAPSTGSSTPSDRTSAPSRVTRSSTRRAPTSCPRSSTATRTRR